ncbi:MAG TPA: RNA polymerase factor sigma-54 [Albidovulum sp.]|uniref:RNA polymerase factor sigma-54 n=1 Tax=Albidovulum sp. TaxID=1872424 RepID=UPI002C962688|nr:RNA polymerase factor sigma-54 [Albidovulum sp.]
MALKSRVHLKTQQGLALSAQMRTAITVLRMPTAALLDDLAREAAENPFLLVEAPARGGGSAYEFALETTAAPESLEDNLTRQLALQRLDPGTLAAATYLIGELREDGYLDVTLAEIAEATRVPLSVLEAGLHALQRCEPPGIGARDLAECLALQLVDTGIADDLARRITASLGDFAAGRWPRLEIVLALSRPELERIADLLRNFRSRPVEADAVMPAMLIPEVRITTSAGQVVARMTDNALPRVARLRTSRAALSSDELRSLYDRAGALAGAVAARASTLLRIAAVIAERQRDFFTGGHASLQPLSRAGVAEALALHPSTVGRALAGKALIADGKVYPFSRFFSRGIAGDSGELSPFDVQRRIRAMIDQEDSRMPLADTEIQSNLVNEGVDIARRTVAKYRKCMRIPSSFARRTRKLLAKDGDQAAARHYPHSPPAR